MLGLALGILKRGCQLLVNPQFKGKTQRYVVKLPKSADAGKKYCPKIQLVPGTLGTCTNSSHACLLKLSDNKDIVMREDMFLKYFEYIILYSSIVILSLNSLPILFQS